MTLLKLLSRKTSGRAVISEVDGFRFFAIATVVLYHLNTHYTRTLSSQVDPAFYQDTWLFRIVSQGSVGVDVFFAISGFILALPFARQHLLADAQVSLKSYFVRRLIRLEPPYVISLIAFFFVHVMILHEVARSIFPNFLASLFYAHSFVYNEWSKINPVAWSLEVEVQFYILAPFLALVFKIPSKWVRRMVMIVIIAVSILHYNLNYQWIEQWHLRKSLLMHLHVFFVGFLMADIFLTDWRGVGAKKGLVWDVLGLCALCTLLLVNQPFRIDHDLLFAACLLLAFVSVFRGHLLNWFFTRPIIVVVGGMCYSIYLLHYAGIAFLATRTAGLTNAEWGYANNFWLQAIVIVPIILFVSAAFFVLIERPCMDKNWPQKLKAKIISFFGKA